VLGRLAEHAAVLSNAAGVERRGGECKELHREHHNRFARGCWQLADSLCIGCWLIWWLLDVSNWRLGNLLGEWQAGAWRLATGFMLAACGR